MTLHNLDINAMKLIFRLSSTHSLIMFPIYETHRGDSAQYSNNLYKMTAKFISLAWKQAEKSCKKSKDILSRINSGKHIFFLGKGKWKLKERILNKQGPRCCLRFTSSGVFKIKCTFLDQEPSLCFEPLLSA